MSNELPEEFQYLVLFAALSGRPFTKSAPELAIKLTVAEIDRLVAETGLLDVTRKGKSRSLSANESTRQWVEANLNVELTGKNKAVLSILHLIRAKTAAFLKTRRLSLSDFLEPAELTAVDGSNPAEQVRRGYLGLSGGSYGARVLLKDLRKRLSLDRETQDAAFLDLIRSGEADFYPEDDPMSRDEEDERAALVLADRRRHIVYLHAEPRT